MGLLDTVGALGIPGITFDHQIRYADRDLKPFYDTVVSSDVQTVCQVGGK